LPPCLVSPYTQPTPTKPSKTACCSPIRGHDSQQLKAHTHALPHLPPMPFTQAPESKHSVCYRTQHQAQLETRKQLASTALGPVGPAAHLVVVVCDARANMNIPLNWRALGNPFPPLFPQQSSPPTPSSSVANPLLDCPDKPHTVPQHRRLTLSQNSITRRSWKPNTPPGSPLPSSSPVAAAAAASAVVASGPLRSTPSPLFCNIRGVSMYVYT
jgi:hypothetical protein